VEDLGLFKGEFPLFPFALNRFPLGIIAGKRFFSFMSLYVFLPSFGCSSHSPFWFKREMFAIFADDGYWFCALIMTVRDRKGETRLVEGFTRSSLKCVICGRAVVFLWGVSAKNVGIVVEMKNSPYFIPLSKAVRVGLEAFRRSYGGCVKDRGSDVLLVEVLDP